MNNTKNPKLNSSRPCVPERDSPVIQAQNIWKTFELGPERLEVLKGIDLIINSGEMVGLLGPSGSGKSTLLNILGTLDRPTAGSVILDSTALFDYSDVALSEIRNKKLGFVFQFHHLLPEFTVLENTIMPLLIAGLPTRAAVAKGMKVLGDINFLHRLRHKPAELSGGEKQKVAVARALVNEPLIILADEPTGNLDRSSSEMLLSLLKQLNETKGVTMLIVTHNEMVANFVHKRYYLRDGKLWETTGTSV
ncbi:MAG: ABC transporter ATP-binding protein [candidate division WOR-3 bacterium]|nr:ABC transporter ATP-binding protein [candidate division WOR-3 bacterium]